MKRGSGKKSRSVFLDATLVTGTRPLWSVVKYGTQIMVAFLSTNQVVGVIIVGQLQRPIKDKDVGDWRSR